MATTLAFCSLFSKEEGEPKQEAKQPDTGLVSESLGHLIGDNLASLGEFDLDRVIAGIKNAAAGKEAPLSESETVQGISRVQEEKFQTIATTNLKEAEDFIAKQSKEEGTLVAEEGKLVYEVVQQGEGPAVTSTDSPRITYTGRLLNGDVFGESTQDERISFDETIPGFTKGIIGMKEGEKRRLYVHPDLAYGTHGSAGMLPQNALLKFDIEVVKANAPEDTEAPLTSIQGGDAHNDIASPELEETKSAPVR